MPDTNSQYDLEFNRYTFVYLLNELLQDRIENLRMLFPNQDKSFAEAIARNEFNRRKSLKLQFLSSVVNIEDQDSLFDVFGSFKAYPLGPVDEVIFEEMKADDLPLFNINQNGLRIKEGEAIEGVEEFLNEKDKTIIGRIKKAVEALKKLNKGLINYSAGELVEITHKWRAWRDAMYYTDNDTSTDYVVMSEDTIREEYRAIGLYYYI